MKGLGASVGKDRIPPGEGEELVVLGVLSQKMTFSCSCLEQPSD